MAKLSLLLVDATLVFGLAFPAASFAQAGGPSGRLEQLAPQLFPPGTLEDAAAAGLAGARIVQLSDALGAIGFESGDLVIEYAGHPVQDAVASPGTSLEAGPWVVWRAIPGERPVLPAEQIGTQVIDQFAALPVAEQSAMRLTTMLANQWTLVTQGAGVVLLPGATGFDTERWLRDANPLPAPSETALREVAQAVAGRAALQDATEGDLAAAREALERGDHLTARERARRAMVTAVVDPAARASSATVQEATDLYNRAVRGESARRVSLMQPEPIIGFVVETQVNRIQAFLPQNTLIDAESSTGGAVLGGIRLRFPGNVAVLSDFFLLAEYGVVKNDFDLRTPSGGTFSTTLQQIGLELMYRPRVGSRLKPFIRGGLGIFSFSARCDEAGGDVIDGRREYGALLGGGIDLVRIKPLRLLTSLVGSYRIVHSKFLPEQEPLVEFCSNTTDVELEDGYYDFDLDGWQVGIMLTFEPWAGH